MFNSGRLLFFSICLCSLWLSGYKELSPMGPTRKIQEENALSAMKKAYDEVDKEKLLNDFLSSAKNSLQADYNLPLCISDREYKVEKKAKLPFEIPEFDITNSTMAQGKRFVPQQKFLIINLEEKSEYEWMKNVYKEGDGIIITKGNYRDKRIRKYPSKYIANQDFMLRYDVKCTPTELIIDSDGARMIERKIRRFQ